MSEEGLQLGPTIPQLRLSPRLPGRPARHDAVAVGVYSKKAVLERTQDPGDSWGLTHVDNNINIFNIYHEESVKVRLIVQRRKRGDNLHLHCTLNGLAYKASPLLPALGFIFTITHTPQGKQQPGNLVLLEGTHWLWDQTHSRILRRLQVGSPL